MLIGMEKEFFVVNPEGQPQVVDENLPADECGWLAEIRTHPTPTILEAVYQLRYEEDKLRRELNALNKTLETPVGLSDTPVMVVPNHVRIEARRAFTKGVCSYQNIYGFKEHLTRGKEATAGVHVSFTNPREVSGYVHMGDDRYERQVIATIHANFDWVQIIRKLDEAFADEIKAAKRRPGFYEVKNDGRIEYRSLPANVDLDKLATVLS